MVTISPTEECTDLELIMSPLTRRWSRIKYLLTQMYELVQHLRMGDYLLRMQHYVILMWSIFSLNSCQWWWECDIVTLFTRINTRDTLCDSMTGYEGLPSCCCLGCCCCCCWCQVLLLQLEVLSWPIRSSYCQFSPNERAVKCNLSSHPPQHASHLSCWAWTGPNIKKREPGCLYFTYTHKNFTVAF